MSNNPLKQREMADSIEQLQGVQKEKVKGEAEKVKREAERLKHLCRTIGLHSEVTRVKGKRAKKIKKEKPQFVKQFFGLRTAIALSQDASDSQQD